MPTDDNMTKITVELPKEVNEKLKRIARADGRPVMRYIQKLVEAHVAKAEKVS